MKDILLKLKEPMPYKWRVQSFSKNKPLATCVAYIDARDVQDRLDSVMDGLWQSDYKEVKGNLFAGIGLYIEDQWIWKWDCGTESNVDAEKGEASDAFKRAAVKWGIGRFLYSLEIKYVKANEIKSDNVWPCVVDDKGKRVWDLTKHIGSIPTNQNPDISELKEAIKKSPTGQLDQALKEMDKCKYLEELEAVWESYPKLKSDSAFVNSKDAIKKKLVFKPKSKDQKDAEDHDVKHETFYK